VRTPLTYYGGKRALARQIVPLMPTHRSYLEPFAGGAAVLFAKPRAERETLNDADGQVMRFWRALRDRPDELAAAVSTTPYSREEWQMSREPADDDVEAARRLLVNVDQSFSRSRQSWSVPCVGGGVVDGNPDRGGTSRRNSSLLPSACKASRWSAVTP
jgi:site-specific DNA-adenine methylase